MPDKMTLQEAEALGITPLLHAAAQEDPVMAALEQTKLMEARAAVERAEHKLQEAKVTLAEQPYTVADLVQDLQKYANPDDVVEAEGCDCIRKVTGVDKHSEPGVAFLEAH